MELKLDKIKLNSPIELIEAFANELSSKHNGSEFEFSIYKSGGPGKTTYRNIIKLSTKECSYTNISNCILNLSHGEEFAFHSRVLIDSEIKHIPLIDYSFKTFGSYKKQFSDIKSITNSNVYLFDTGRSYHGYLNILLSEKLWYEYLGKLLLINPAFRNKEFIDSRWIGHSLEQQFSSLRLSHNTNYYLKPPLYRTII